jgi:DIS3-like exonuclease 2
LLRVNPNNRNRAFVTIEGVPIDVMIDGLGAQNRALDGDTVVISLVEPARWPPLTTQSIIIGGNKVEEKKNGGFTNETAIETRVIDVERGLSHTEDH